LTRNGVLVRKFFLHVSNKEQRKRFLSRIEEPEKNWKFSANDAKEREYWDEYMEAYEDMIRNTATKRAPWYVVPADNKWFTRVVVAAAVIDALSSMDLAYPTISDAKRKDLAAAKRHRPADEQAPARRSSGPLAGEKGVGRAVEGREHGGDADVIQHPSAVQPGEHVTVDVREAEVDTPCRQLARQRVEHVRAGQVEESDRAPVQDQPFGPRMARDDLQHPPLEEVRIEEHDPGAESVDHEAGIGGRVRMLGQGVPAPHPRHAAQLRVRRPRGPLDQQEERESHRDQDAVQHVQPDHSDHGDEREPAIPTDHT